MLLLPELLLASVLGVSDVLLVAGQVESVSSQHVVVPLTTNFQAKISYLVDEGVRIEPGEVVARFDGTAVESQLRSAREELDKLIAEGERDAARLRITVADAEIEKARADVEQDVAQMESEVPANFIGELDYQENQLALERAVNRYGQAAKKLDDARGELDSRIKRTELDIAARQERIRRWEKMLASFEIIAEQPGFIVHDSHPWMRNKFETGDNVQTGWTIASIADDRELKVTAWVNEVDAPHVENDTPVQIRFDAVPQLEASATLTTLSAAPESKTDWGRAAYHQAELRLSDVPAGTLLPGMSALIEIPIDRPAVNVVPSSPGGQP